MFYSSPSHKSSSHRCFLPDAETYAELECSLRDETWEHLICSTSNRNGLTSIIFRTQSQQIVAVFQTLNGLGSKYIQDLLVCYELTRSLRSSGSSLLSVHRVRTEHGEVAFSFYTPHIHLGMRISTFKSEAMVLSQKRVEMLSWAERRCFEEVREGWNRRSADGMVQPPPRSSDSTLTTLRCLQWASDHLQPPPRTSESGLQRPPRSSDSSLTSSRGLQDPLTPV